MATSNTTGTYGYRELYIASKDRTSGTSSNFTVTLPTPVAMTQVYVKNVYLPQGFYLFSGSYFYMSIGGGAAFQVALPDGNYSIGTLVNALNNITAISGAGIIVTSNFQTNTITFTLGTTILSMIAQDATSFITLQNLGFAPRTTNPYTATYPYTYNGTTDGLTCPYVMNLVGYGYLFIKSKTIAQYTLVQPTFSTNTYDQNIIAQVPIGQAFSLITWQNQNDLRFLLNNSQVIISIDFQLQGDFGQPVNLNGIEWALTLGFYN
jgi:hypothetical protein